MRAALLALLLLATGCSLPLPEGVQISRDDSVVESDSGAIQVMPPGPQEGATPQAVVRGFLGAASSPEGGYAIARKFLAPKTRWIGDQVQVYDSLRIDAPPASAAGAAAVTVTFKRLAVIDPQGRYTSGPPTEVTESYLLQQDDRKQWRISQPPRGIRLLPADRARSYPSRRIYYLAKRSQSVHVVPDQVLLPVSATPGAAELTRLLAGPSSAIAGSVETAFPDGTQLVSVGTSGGIYDVALSTHVLAAGREQRKHLSAQLVWTLRSLDPRFRGLRIKVGDDDLDVAGEGLVQLPDAWGAYDPERLEAGSAYYVADNRVQALVGGRRAVGPLATRNLPVQSVAVTPDRSQIAVLQRGRVRRGPPDGRQLPEVPAPSGVSSPSWGTGERGLWLLDGLGRVILLDRNNKVIPVSVPGISGRITWLATSRDGVRSALVVDGSLYVGRVTPVGSRLAIVGATPIAREISGVTRVAWRDPTTMVVLGKVSDTFVPAVVAVDGSSVRPLPVSGLPARAQEVAASSLGVVVSSDGRLFQLSNLGFRPGPPGRAPAFPG